MDVGECGDQRRPVSRLELIVLTGVADDLDHRTNVVRGTSIGGDHVVEIGLRRNRFANRLHVPLRGVGRPERGDDPPYPFERVLVVVREVVGHPGHGRVHQSATEVLGADIFSGCGLHQWRSGEEDGALIAHDHRLVTHGRHVGTTGCGRPEHSRDLRDTCRTHVGLIEEDAPEMVAVGKDLVLLQQHRAA